MGDYGREHNAHSGGSNKEIWITGITKFCTCTMKKVRQIDAKIIIQFVKYDREIELSQVRRKNSRLGL